MSQLKTTIDSFNRHQWVWIGKGQLPYIFKLFRHNWQLWMYLQQWICRRWSQLHKYVWAQYGILFSLHTDLVYMLWYGSTTTKFYLQNFLRLTMWTSLYNSRSLWTCIAICQTILFHSDINECELDSLNDCDENANCSDTIGSYNCSCKTGYEGDGFNCTGYTTIDSVLVFCFFVCLFVCLFFVVCNILLLFCGTVTCWFHPSRYQWMPAGYWSLCECRMYQHCW